MKYLVIIIVSVFVGFVAAWLLFQNATNGEVSPARALPAPTFSLPQANRGDTGGASGSAVLTFGDIANARDIFETQLLAWQVASRASFAEARAMIDECLSKSDPVYHDNIAAILVERLVQLDARAAMNYVTSEPRFDQDYIQGHVLTSWVRYDPEAAIDYFKRIVSPQTRNAIGARLLQDPFVTRTGLVAEVREILGPMADRIQEQITLQNADPRTLFESALSMDGNERVGRLTYAIMRWAQTDPEAALARAASLTGNEKSIVVQRAIYAWAQRDPKGAWDYQQLHFPEDTRMQQQILTMMAQQDMSEALLLVENIIATTGSSDVLQGILGPWIQNEPERAIRYVESLNLPDKTRLMQTAAFQYVNSHPDEGFNWVFSLGDEYQGIKQSIARSVNPRNVDTAQRILPSITDAPTRSAMIAGIANVKSNADPDEALRWLDAYRRDPSYQDAYQAVVSNIARRDPERAAGLISQLSDQEDAAPAMISIAQMWYRRSPDEAIRWVSSLEDGVAKSQAISSLVGTVANRDVDAAVALARELPESSRQNAMYNIAQVWSHNEPERLDEIVRTLALRPELAESLRNMLKEKQMKTLIKGGRVYDHETNQFLRQDVLIDGGRVASIHSSIDTPADETIDASGQYVSAGLIDLHCHIFDHPLYRTSRLQADRIGVRQGVACLLDTGSAGPTTIDAFKEFVIGTQQTAAFALCNIGSPGQPGVDGGHSAKPELISLSGTVKAIERNPDWILGVKVLASSSHTGLMGIEAVKIGRKAAELTGTPLMVHIGNAPPVIEEILELLRPGDIMTHAYHGKVGGVLGYKGVVIPEFRGGGERGVIVDIAHGRSSFAFRTCEAAMEQGMPVHTISSDLHGGNVDRYVVSLARTMSKFRLLGLPLEEVIRAVTLAPARAIGLERFGFGTLTEGGDANITVFSETDREVAVEDAQGEVRTTRHWIEPTHVFVRGNHFQPDATL